MFVIVGATGHIGTAAVDALLGDGEDVLAIAHEEDDKAHALRAKGAEVAVVDVLDTDALRDVFRRGTRAFLLNPPADPGGNTDVEEHRTLASIVSALDGSGLEKVVLASVSGARPGDAIGDLSTLYDFEQALARQPIPFSVNRGGYYLSNFDALLDSGKQGRLPTMLPGDLRLPMVAPEDLGRAAARRLREPVSDTGVLDIEGPDRYTTQDVADAFARALDRPVALDVAPRETWEDQFKELGFSDASARAYARMTEVTVEGAGESADPERGEITLQSYIDALVAREA